MLLRGSSLHRLFSTKIDYYTTLRLGNSFSAKELKDSYRSLTKTFHPDRNHDKNARMMFEQVQEAYAVLNDSNKKEIYDRLGLTLKEQENFNNGDFDVWSFKQFWEFKGGFYNNPQMFKDILEYLTFNQKDYRRRPVTIKPGEDAETKVTLGFFENSMKLIRKNIIYKVGLLFRPTREHMFIWIVILKYPAKPNPNARCATSVETAKATGSSREH